MKKVLIVDDEKRMAELIKLYLEPNGYCCDILYSGAEAIRYVKDCPADLILMDVMMTGKNGWETAQEIRKFSEVPIVMLTARNQYSDIIQSINHGADGYIAKPFDEKNLLFHVGRLIGNKSSIKQKQLEMS
jgi:DNA-binding response OmpR family regulator